MNRRHLLRSLAAGLLVPAGFAGGQVANKPKPRAAPSVQALQRDWKRLLASDAKVAPDATPIVKPDAEWQRELDPAAYKVLRHEGTEAPFSSPLNDEHRPGIFVCAGCALPLFSSDMKFDSGTGWPSFFTTIPGAFATKADHLLLVERTEYHCAKCGGHHGHVFDDGPAPTGLRYCNNGVALRFIPLQV